jgi:hypothetical protein
MLKIVSNARAIDQRRHVELVAEAGGTRHVVAWPESGILTREDVKRIRRWANSVLNLPVPAPPAPARPQR